MKYLSNIYDPKRPDAKSRAVDWVAQQRWLSDKSIERPRATDHYTVEELEALGMVGVYLPLTE